jgi:hypothetical protein
MNDKNIFPDEILIQIILECNYKSIVTLKSACIRFNDIIKRQSLLNKKCNMNYPRVIGKAGVHNIKTNYQKFTPYNIITDFTLNYIINKDVDIINGDYIQMDKNYGRELYDTFKSDWLTKFIFYNFKLYPIDKRYNFLPHVCQIITNNVPSDYWSNHNLTVYIDQKLVKDQAQAIGSMGITPFTNV